MLAAIKMPNAADRTRAEELHRKQLVAGERVLNALPKPPRIRVSPGAYRDAERFFAANRLESGMKPHAVEPDCVKELLAANVLERTGHARATRYRVLVRPLDLVSDDSLVAKRVVPRSNGRVPAEQQANKILQIDNATKAYIRVHAREYLAFATGAEARRHEEKRQSENILDVINARAKEIVRLSKAGDGPRVTPVAAIAIAQEELAEDFETRLKRKWRPVMFELFGMADTQDR